jgi:hypothetical protein
LPTLPLEEILVDPRCQARVELDADTVKEYADALERGDDLPPIDVFAVQNGDRVERYVTDGIHRRAAHLALGRSFAVIRQVGYGTMEEAIWTAAAANTKHGLKRSRADKRRAVLLALDTGIGVEQSNAALAAHVGVSDMLVAAVRAEWEAARAPTLPELPRERVGRDGKRRPAPPPRLPQVLEEEPAAEPEEPAEDTQPQVLEVPRVEKTRVPMPRFGEALARTEGILRSARLRSRTEIPEELDHLKQRLEVGLKALENAIVAVIPEACPACRGEGCAPCGQQGWVSGADAAAMRERAKRGA